MQLNEYQAQLVSIWETQKTPDEQLLFCAVGMAEESGEAMGKVKRAMRGEVFDREAYLKELGDTLAYLAIAAHSQGICWGAQTYTAKCHQILPNTLQLMKDTIAFLDFIVEDVFATDFDWGKALLNDILETLTDCATSPEVNSTLTEVMQLNLDKLADRKARLGTLRGSGDDR